jgi:AcrR family transcriptional regulator
VSGSVYGPALQSAFAADPDTELLTPTDERILDAALELIGAYGTRRTSMDDIAERARVGRRTVFRRFGSKERVIERLFTRELRRFLGTVNETIAGTPDAATSVVELFVAVVRFGASHPLVSRLARVEPQVLIDALRAGDPSAMELTLSFIAGRIRAAQHRGNLPPRDADHLADVMVRLALSYILIPSRDVDLDDDQALRAFARSAIAPVATGRP